MMQQSTQVVLVNEQDEMIGTMDKMAAHQSPHLHRAFSVFLFDDKNRMLLQQRAVSKYHSGGLWTNTCCSHPFPGEEICAAANRRLKEEMGMEATLENAFHFTYKASFDNGLHEHEFDHVFIGKVQGNTIHPDPNEVAGFCFKSLDEVNADMQVSGHKYTAWFKIALPFLEAYLAEKKDKVVG
jgi:isopentenyl-diphosphate delta-isomerase